MNKNKRETLRQAVSLLHEASGKIQSVCDSEQDALDNLPENLQYSDRFAAMESAVDALESAQESLEEAVNSVEEAIQA